MLSWAVPIGTSRMNPFTHEQSFETVCLFKCTSVQDPLFLTYLFSCFVLHLLKLIKQKCPEIFIVKCTVCLHYSITQLLSLC